MNALEILLAQVEHTAQLAPADGSKLTASKLVGHLIQFREAREAARENPEGELCEVCGFPTQRKARNESGTKMKRIARCGCGNLSVDGLNFSRVEDGLQCAACGAVSSDFEFVRLSEFKQRLLSEETLEKAASSAFVPPVSNDRKTDIRWAIQTAIQAAEEGE